MPTIGEWKKAQADSYAKEQQTLVNVLQQRMKWHQEEWGKTEDPTLKNVHEELFKRDQDTLDEVREKYEKRTHVLKIQKIDLPALKFEE